VWKAGIDRMIILADLKEIGYESMDWVHLAQNRYQ
jgi:hypothetical protein